MFVLFKKSHVTTFRTNSLIEDPAAWIRGVFNSNKENRQVVKSTSYLNRKGGQL